MATDKKKTINASKSGNIGEDDDGYFRSCNSSPVDGLDSDSDETFGGSSSSSSGIDSTDDEMDSKSVSTGAVQQPAKSYIIDSHKFNPETRAVLMVDSTRYRRVTDFFQPPNGCSYCKVQFNTIDELNEHKDHNEYHSLVKHLETIHLDMQRAPVSVSNYSDDMPRIGVTAYYEAAVMGIGAKINVLIENQSYGDTMKLENLFWIDKSENDRLMLFNELITFPRSITAQNHRMFCVAFETFQLMKHYELIIYFEYLNEKFATKCNFRVTNKPIITMRMSKLQNYFPTSAIRSLQRTNYELVGDKMFSEEEKLLHQRITEFKSADNKSRLTSENYHSMMKLMLQMEDEIESAKCMSFDQENQKVDHVRERIYSLKVNSKRLDEATAEYTRLWITPVSMRSEGVARNDAIRKILQKNPAADVRLWRTQRIYGSIINVKNGLVLFELDKHLDTFTEKTNVVPSVEVYFIRFLSNRTTVALEHRALDLFDQHEISKFFFPSRGDLVVKAAKSAVDTASQIEWISEVNDEQRAAVENILCRTSYPHPYILFGPPGTGKTKTLVEAIGQIIKRNDTGEHILVCATSNSACDEIADRLLKNNPNDQVFRMFSISQTDRMGKIPTDVLAASNLCKGEHYYPTLMKLYQHKVVICTLTTAGRLSQAHINPRHFTHVFVDESGSATETQTLIAIAGICTSKNLIHASITFAGDPKQLGPIIKSHAVKLGYGVSMLERLMDTDVYGCDAKTKLFNAKYVTQLIRNYRSHETILHASNELFYDNALQVHAAKSNTDWFLDSRILLTPQFPFIFHSVRGHAVKLPKETSLFNITEINLVVSYLQKLFNGKMIERSINQSDVGIISPYRKQCEKLTEKCQQLKWTDIQIGSVETFQGQERPIIIVSTVRSRMRDIGFLDNAKRLNVLLTRAKCLMIIIGDTKTLARDANWAHVIKYCENNGSLIVDRSG